MNICPSSFIWIGALLLQVKAHTLQNQPLRRQDASFSSLQNSTRSGQWCNQSLADIGVQESHVACLQLGATTSETTTVSTATDIPSAITAWSSSTTEWRPLATSALSRKETGISAPPTSPSRSAIMNTTSSRKLTDDTTISSDLFQLTASPSSSSPMESLVVTTTVPMPVGSSLQSTAPEETSAMASLTTSTGPGPGQTETKGGDKNESTSRSSDHEDSGPGVVVPVPIPTVPPPKDGSPDTSSIDEPPKSVSQKDTSKTIVPTTNVDDASKGSRTHSASSSISTNKPCQKGNTPSRTKGSPDAPQSKTYKTYQTAATTAVSRCAVVPQACQISDGDDVDEVESESANTALEDTIIQKRDIWKLFKRGAETDVRLPGGLVKMQAAKYPLRKVVIDGIASGEKQAIFEKPILFTSDLLNITKVDAISTTTRSVLERTNIEHIIEVSFQITTKTPPAFC